MDEETTTTTETTIELTAEVPGKAVWQSKVLWFNLFALLLMFAEVVTTQQLLSPDLLKWITAFTVFGNMVLRMFFTSQPIGLPQILDRRTAVLPTIDELYQQRLTQAASDARGADTGEERPF